MELGKATNISLDVGRYDGCGNLFFTANGLTTRYEIAAQIEFLITLQDSLSLTDDENKAFNIIIDMLHAQKQKGKLSA